MHEDDEMSIREDREQRDRTFQGVILTAITMFVVWLLFTVTLWIIGA
jgi:hypothetical protein